MSDFVNVLEPMSGKLLFKYDATRDIIEIQRRGIKTVVDLRKIQEERHERQITNIIKDRL